ncbi:hypothetical protein [Tamlana flava]|uniref:hypothetical protein n=1 Tax=Tamlana flava TaxID=3158572 RepID=UPI00351B6127
MIKSISLLVMLWAGITFAQEFKVKGEIHVNADGLYRIHIPHGVRSYSKSGLQDFRIWDSQGSQVPYFVTSSNENTVLSNFEEFPIISSSNIADSTATYVFKNPYKTIEQAVLLIANYKGSKRYRLEGSNNQKEWFGIVNSGQLNQLSHPTQTRIYKVISFPLCAYQYLKIVFNDEHSLPVNLLKIGTTTTQMLPVLMENIPVQDIAFEEKERHTEIHIRFERTVEINQIKLDITAPDLYNRDATLYTIRQREVKQKMETYRKQLSTFSIRSDEPQIFNITNCNEKEIYLKINNGDNPKLEISGIHLLQNPLYVIANLKNNEKYLVTAGNDTLNFPDYDISDVTNTAIHDFPIAQIRALVYSKSIKENLMSSFWEKSWFMWCCIILAAIMILYFAFSLLRDMKN